MSTEVDQLARGVERVSLTCQPQKNVFRTPSLNEEVEHAASTGSDEDVDMSDAPCIADVDELVAKRKSTPVEYSSHQTSTPCNESGAYTHDDVSTKSFHMSPESHQRRVVSLRREGRPSLGLIEEFISLFQGLLFASICFYLSYSSTFSGSTGNHVDILGKVLFVVTPIIQVSRMLRLSYSLFQALLSRAIYKNRLLKRRRTSRVNLTSGTWAISVVDRVDNFILKILVWLLFMMCRICIILLCVSCQRFGSVVDDSFLAAGINHLDFFAKTVLGFDYAAVLNTNLDANILQECKTVPELVFENRYVCT